MSQDKHCWICGSSDLKLLRESTIGEALKTEDFSITDANYGVTAAIYRCQQCGFRQCSDLANLQEYYTQLEDDEYEHGRKERGMQAARLLEILKSHVSSGRLLDIGAGSGILLEQAARNGYSADGIEPSEWLSRQGRKRGLRILTGALPDPALEPVEEAGRYDVVTAIDVLEHVAEPVELLNSINRFLKQQGVAMIVTPDAGSFFARLLGFKWWHYRVAHVGYFRKPDLVRALSKAGLTAIKWKRPAWYFPMSYLWVRLMQYFPRSLRIKPPAFMEKIIMPLNLFDSWLLIVKKTDE